MTAIMMRTGVADGRVKGEIANLAALGSTNAWFDLGPNWTQFSVVQVVVVPAGASSGLSNVQAFSENDPAATSGIPLGFSNAIAGGLALIASLTTASGGQSFTVRPMARYLRIAATNADAVNPLGAASTIAVAAY